MSNPCASLTSTTETRFALIYRSTKRVLALRQQSVQSDTETCLALVCLRALSRTRCLARARERRRRESVSWRKTTQGGKEKYKKTEKGRERNCTISVGRDAPQNGSWHRSKRRKTWFELESAVLRCIRHQLFYPTRPIAFLGERNHPTPPPGCLPVR